MTSPLLAQDCSRAAVFTTSPMAVKSLPAVSVGRDVPPACL